MQPIVIDFQVGIADLHMHQFNMVQFNRDQFNRVQFKRDQFVAQTDDC